VQKPHQAGIGINALCREKALFGVKVSTFAKDFISENTEARSIMYLYMG
jgi:hypothetical protein